MDLQPILDDIDAQARAAGDWGQVADYIPALARIDPAQFAIAVALPDGRCLTAGQAETRFSIQSVSKVFTLALALGRHGEGLWARVGREPTERAFNSIVQLETSGGIPRNPFVNPGAIVTTDACLAGRTPRETLGEILRFLREASGSEAVVIDPEVAASERAHGHRNFALAHFLASTGNLENSVDRALGTYFHQCAIEMTCLELALAGRFLCDAFTGQRLIPTARVRAINALMMTCGHYDGSGAFACDVGFPGKSGVGGGILAIVPNTAAIAVWSPGLNAFGNSRQGTLALERLSRATGWSVFA